MSTQVVALCICLVFIVIISVLFLLFCRRKRKGRRPPARRALCLILLLAVLIAALGGSAFASAKLAKKISPQPGPEPPLEKKEFVLMPAKAFEDVLPQFFSLFAVKDSEMLGLIGTEYHFQATTAEDFKTATQRISDTMKLRRSTKQLFPFHRDISWGTANPSTTLQSPTSLDEYDAQILGQVSLLETADNWAEKEDAYFWISIFALGALQGIANGQFIADDQKRWSYGEIAFTALMNQFICREGSKSCVDLFYRLGQVYDHMGIIADTENQKFALYFVSAVFHRLSYNDLEACGFSRDGLTYWASVWEYNMEMTYRFGLWATDGQEFYQLARDCGNQVQALDGLSDEQQQILTQKLSQLEG